MLPSRILGESASLGKPLDAADGGCILAWPDRTDRRTGADVRHICLSLSFAELTGTARSDAESFAELVACAAARYGYAVRRIPPDDPSREILVRNATYLVLVPIEWDDAYLELIRIAEGSGTEVIVLWPSYRALRSDLVALTAVRNVFTWKRLGPAYELLKGFFREHPAERLPAVVGDATNAPSGAL
jgi:hypothetical protein